MLTYKLLVIIEYLAMGSLYVFLHRTSRAGNQVTNITCILTVTGWQDITHQPDTSPCIVLIDPNRPQYNLSHMTGEYLWKAFCISSDNSGW